MLYAVRINFFKMFSYFVFLILFCNIILAEETRHPCSLEWVGFSTGSALPDKAISSEKDQIFAIRGKVSDTYFAGYYNYLEEKALIYNPTNSNATILLSFEILANPHDCIINWLNKGHNDVASFSVAIKDGTNDLIGRASSTINEILYTGHIDTLSGQIFIPQDDATYNSTIYFVLTSSTAEMTLSLDDFVFAEDVFGGPTSIIGMDEIINDSEAEVSQTVTHRRSLSSRLEFRSVVSFTVAKQTDSKSGWDLGFIANSGKSSQLDSETTTNDTSFERKETSEFRVSREINLPPFSAVQACTLMQIRENFQTTWTAIATFSAPGVNPIHIVSWLKTEEGWGTLEYNVENSLVKTEISGDFIGSFAVNSKFFVTTDGCTEIKKFLRQNKKKDWREEERFINNIMGSTNDPKYNI